MSQFSRKRSNMIPGPPAVREDLNLKNPTCNHWEQCVAQTVSDSCRLHDVDEIFITFSTYCCFPWGNFPFACGSCYAAGNKP
jgi:hypothetical protein